MSRSEDGIEIKLSYKEKQRLKKIEKERIKQERCRVMSKAFENFCSQIFK